MEIIKVLRQDCMDCKWFVEREVNPKNWRDFVDVAKYLQILATSHEGLMEHRVGRAEIKEVVKDI